MKLTQCTNCNKIFEDLNPGDGSLDYPDSDLYPELPTIEHEEEDGVIYVGYGCDVCKTDGYLIDNILA